MERRLSLFWPLTLIAAGVIWILVTAHIIPVANLWALTHFWPFLLIGAGVGLLLRPYWKYSSVAVDVVIVGGAVLAIWFAPQLGWASPFPLAFTIHDGANWGPGEAGSGRLTTQTRPVADFQSIKVDYPAEVIIQQGTAASLTLEAEDNVLPGLKTEVNNGQLEIFYEPVDGRNINPTRPVRMTIVVKDLSKVDFTSAGALKLQNLTVNGLDLFLSGAGSVDLNNIQARKLTVRLSGAGNMTASGAADALDVIISGFGDFKGGDLSSHQADVRISGAGNATVWVDGKLNADITGAGSVGYYGSPDVTRQITGVGSVNSLGDK